MRPAHVIALDSGIGGLGIVSSLRRAIPGLAVTYLADHAFFPYGSRDGAVLAERLVRLVAALAEARPPDLVVIACNTASTAALPTLRARLPHEFAGCVPAVKWAASVSRTRTIGLLATEATVGRDYVRDLQRRFAPDARLVAHGARHLAALAEQKFAGIPIDASRIAAELATLFAKADRPDPDPHPHPNPHPDPDPDRGDAAPPPPIDTICLGCTHYGLLLDELRAAAPPDIVWLDPADAVARHVATRLADPERARPARPVTDDLAFSTALPPDPASRAALGRGFARHGFERLEPFDLPAAEEVPAAPSERQCPRRTA